MEPIFDGHHLTCSFFTLGFFAGLLLAPFEFPHPLYAFSLVHRHSCLVTPSLKLEIRLAIDCAAHPPPTHPVICEAMRAPVCLGNSPNQLHAICTVPTAQIAFLACHDTDGA